MSTPQSLDPPADPPADWPAWERVVADRAVALADGGVLTVAGTKTQTRMARPNARTGLVGLIRPGRRRPTAPSLQLVRVEDHLRGHLAGAERTGGPFPWTREEEEQILALGWHRPMWGDGDDFIRFWPDDVPQGPYLPRADAERAAAAVALTFRELVGSGPDTPAGLPVIVED